MSVMKKLTYEEFADFNFGYFGIPPNRQHLRLGQAFLNTFSQYEQFLEGFDLYNETNNPKAMRYIIDHFVEYEVRS